MKKWSEIIYEIKTMSSLDNETIMTRITELEKEIDTLAEEWENGRASKNAALTYFKKTKPIQGKILKYNQELLKRANDPAKIKLKKIEKKVIKFINKVNAMLPSSGVVKSH
jgi:hypothetical protein